MSLCVSVPSDIIFHIPDIMVIDALVPTGLKQFVAAIKFRMKLFFLEILSTGHRMFLTFLWRAVVVPYGIIERPSRGPWEGPWCYMWRGDTFSSCVLPEQTKRPSRVTVSGSSTLSPNISLQSFNRPSSCSISVMRMWYLFSSHWRHISTFRPQWTHEKFIVNT